MGQDNQFDSHQQVHYTRSSSIYTSHVKAMTEDPFYVLLLGTLIEGRAHVKAMTEYPFYVLLLGTLIEGRA